MSGKVGGKANGGSKGKGGKKPKVTIRDVIRQAPKGFKSDF